MICPLRWAIVNESWISNEGTCVRTNTRREALLLHRDGTSSKFSICYIGGVIRAKTYPGLMHAAAFLLNSSLFAATESFFFGFDLHVLRNVDRAVLDGMTIQWITPRENRRRFTREFAGVE